MAGTRPRYEAPAITERTQLDMPLIGTQSGQAGSAVFRAETPYEAPAIVERTPLDMPLIGGTSPVVCAVFR